MAGPNDSAADALRDRRHAGYGDDFLRAAPTYHASDGCRLRSQELEFAEPQEEPIFDNLQTREEREREEALNRKLSEKGIAASSGLDVGNDMLPPAGSPLEIQLKHLQLIANEEPERVAEVLKQWVNVNEHSRVKAESNA